MECAIFEINKAFENFSDIYKESENKLVLGIFDSHKFEALK